MSKRLSQNQHVAAGNAIHLLGGDVNSAKLFLAHAIGKTNLLLLLKLKPINGLLRTATGRSSGRRGLFAQQLIVLGIAKYVGAETANDFSLGSDLSVDILGH